MLDRRVIQREIGRLAGTEYFGTLNEAAIRELHRALASAPSEVIAVAVINEWLQGRSMRPTPSDLYQAIREHARRAQAPTMAKPAEVSFESWRKAGGPDDWDAFLRSLGVA